MNADPRLSILAHRERGTLHTVACERAPELLASGHWFLVCTEPDDLTYSPPPRVKRRVRRHVSIREAIDRVRAARADVERARAENERVRAEVERVCSATAGPNVTLEVQRFCQGTQRTFWRHLHGTYRAYPSDGRALTSVDAVIAEAIARLHDWDDSPARIESGPPDPVRPWERAVHRGPYRAVVHLPKAMWREWDERATRQTGGPE